MKSSHYLKKTNNLLACSRR